MSRRDRALRLVARLARRAASLAEDVADRIDVEPEAPARPQVAVRGASAATGDRSAEPVAPRTEPIAPATPEDWFAHVAARTGPPADWLARIAEAGLDPTEWMPNAAAESPAVREDWPGWLRRMRAEGHLAVAGEHDDVSRPVRARAARDASAEPPETHPRGAGPSPRPEPEARRERDVASRREQTPREERPRRTLPSAANVVAPLLQRILERAAPSVDTEIARGDREVAERAAPETRPTRRSPPSAFGERAPTRAAASPKSSSPSRRPQPRRAVDAHSPSSSRSAPSRTSESPAPPISVRALEVPEALASPRSPVAPLKTPPEPGRSAREWVRAEEAAAVAEARPARRPSEVVRIRPPAPRAPTPATPTAPAKAAPEAVLDLEDHVAPVWPRLSSDGERTGAGWLALDARPEAPGEAPVVDSARDAARRREQEGAAWNA